MVDTKDSKSFVSDGVRVQVSSPVKRSCLRKTFSILNHLFQDSGNFGFHEIGKRFS